MRIPIRIEDDDCVSSLEIETQTSSTGGQQEDEVVRVGAVEDSQLLTSLVTLCHAVQPGTNDVFVGLADGEIKFFVNVVRNCVPNVIFDFPSF